jgi:hypothetical protein
MSDGREFFYDARKSPTGRASSQTNVLAQIIAASL